MIKRIIGLSSTAALLVATTVAGPAAAVTNDVNDRNLDVDWFMADTRAGGTLGFTEVAGVGAARLATTDSDADKVQLLTHRYAGTSLADLTEISYRTYRSPDSTGFIAALPALNMRVDLDGDGTPETYLVYEPYQDQGNGAVHTDEWQTWDAHRDGAAKWWGSSQAARNLGCGQSSPCTLDRWSVVAPDATIEEDTDFPGSLGLNLGSSNASTIGGVDWLTVGTDAGSTTYDFNPVVYGKDDCKNGGWRTNFDGEFRNQGECVSHFARAGK